jgi:hypothetical protein
MAVVVGTSKRKPGLAAVVWFGVTVCLLMILPGESAADSNSRAVYRSLVRNLRWVLVEVDGLDSKEKPDNLAALIRQDVRKKTAPAGISARITTDKDRIGSATYVRVRVHKFALERTVYMSTVELVPTPGDLPVGGVADPPPKYTSLSNQLKTVRGKVTYLVRDLIRDYAR